MQKRDIVQLDVKEAQQIALATVNVLTFALTQNESLIPFDPKEFQEVLSL